MAIILSTVCKNTKNPKIDFDPLLFITKDPRFYHRGSQKTLIISDAGETLYL